MPSCCTPGHGDAGAVVLSPALPGPRTEAARRAARRLVDLAGGRLLMGTDDPDGFPADGEGPVREVTASPFRLAATTVTNAQFATFVKATGHVTEAEEFGFSFVFGGSPGRHMCNIWQGDFPALNTAEDGWEGTAPVT